MGVPSSPAENRASTFAQGTAFNLEFRGEMFNATNSVHFGRPNVTVNAAQGERITNTQAPNRNVQFELRLGF